MALSEAQLRILVTAEDKASKKLGKVTSAMAKMGKQAVLLGAVAGAALAVFGFKAVSAASDAAEAQNKANEVFGDSIGIINKFSEDSANAFGISTRAANEYAGTIGLILTGSGLAGDAAAEMSVDVVKLAADMASFNNLPTEDVLNKIRAGLVGEAEPLRQVGILINDAAVKQEAYNSRIAATGALLTDAQKVQARYNLILEQSAVQQGDFARTSDSMANVMKRIGAIWEDMQVLLGQRLLPKVEELLGLFADNMPAAFAKFERVLDDFAPVLEQVSEDFIALGSWIVNNRAALVISITAVGVAFAIFFPGGALLVGLNLILLAFGVLRTDIDRLGKSAIKVRIFFLELARDAAQGLRDAQNLLSFGVLPALEAITGKALFATRAVNTAENAIINARQALQDLENDAARARFGDMLAAQAHGAEIKFRDLEAAAIDALTAAFATGSALEAQAAATDLALVRAGIIGTRAPVIATTPPSSVLPPSSLGGGTGSADTAPTVAEKWAKAGEAIAAALARGLVTGKLSVRDAIEKLMDAMEKVPVEFRNAFNDAASAISDFQGGLDKVGQIWSDIVERGKAGFEDVLALIEAGSLVAAQDVLDHMAGKSSEIGAAIFQKTQEEAAKAAKAASDAFVTQFNEGLASLEGRIGSAFGRIAGLAGTLTAEGAGIRLTQIKLERRLLKLKDSNNPVTIAEAEAIRERIAAMSDSMAAEKLRQEAALIQLKLDRNLLPTAIELNAQIVQEIANLDALTSVFGNLSEGVFSVIDASTLMLLGFESLAESILAINAGLVAPGAIGTAGGFVPGQQTIFIDTVVIEGDAVEGLAALGLESIA